MNIVVLCGGNGTRLWPLSRKKLPKQFLPLVNDKTMFQNTLLRFEHLKTDYLFQKPIVINRYIIICNKEHHFMVEEQMKELELEEDYTIVTEPMGRDTAAAVAIAALMGDGEDISLVVPCDHIFNDEEFCNVVKMGYNNYVDNAIVTFGILPTCPETGYGYIEVGEHFKTLNFTEKPNLEFAESYVKNGHHYWNAGVFMFQNKTMLTCFEKYAMETLTPCLEASMKSLGTIENNTLHLGMEEFSKCPEISVDYAIMENLTKDDSSDISAYTLPYNNKWSDIGSFKVLHEECEKDENGNVVKGDIVPYNTKNCYIESDKATVATIGLENLVIVNTRDALLISHKDQSQDVKNVLKEFHESQEELKIVHAKAYRPWGWYINVEGNDHSGYKVKRIGVYPGKRLSLQSHNHRSEHWVITKGKARVQLNEEFIEMGPNEHVYIPVTALHRMENIGDEMVEFVETQIGDYLGEDDIVRYEDDFGRA
tara:strand:- start:114 stop:1556 length:1443 start_codon:yes stop_codon:yes gene_type:complete